MSTKDGQTNDLHRVTIVVDNHAGKGLLSEHGLSLWIETGQQRILLDTGQGKALAANAEGLDIDLSGTDALVVSHGHYDHTGDIAGVLRAAPEAQVLCHPSAVIPRYGRDADKPRPLGMQGASKRILDGLPAQRMHWIQSGQEWLPGIGVTGSILRTTAYEDTGGDFYLDPELSRSDPIDDDMALWIRTRRGVVACVGCCHAGLINTLHQVLRQSGAPRLQAVIGGFHLLNANDRRIDATVDALRSLAPDLIVPCHCTGERAVEALQNAFGDDVIPGVSGAVFYF